MRRLPYITVGRVLAAINKELEKQGKQASLSRITFYRLEAEGLFQSKKSAGGWRIYTPTEAAIVVKLILENYGIKEIDRSKDETKEIESIVKDHFK